MNENMSSAGDPANGAGGAAATDRYFVADKGLIRGPLTHTHIQTTPKVPGSVIWQPGHTDWQPWGPPEANVAGPVTSNTKSWSALWVSLGRRGRAVREAAALEVQAVRALRGVAAARQTLQSHVRAYGRLAIDQRIHFDDTALDRRIADVSALQSEIAKADAGIAEQRAVLDRLDPKSPAAIRAKQTAKGLNGERDRLVAALLRLESGVGELIRSQLEPDPRFEGIRAEADLAQAHLLAARADLEAIERRRHAADEQIGVPLRTVAACLVGILLLVACTAWWAFQRATPAVLPGVQLDPTQASAGLAKDQLRLSAGRIDTKWRVWRPGTSGLLRWTPVPDAENGIVGSTGVIAGYADGRLALITNRHVLDLDALMASKLNGDLAIKDYQIIVKFPGGQTRPVIDLAIEASGLDLAVLTVDGHGLRPGVDYVLLPILPAGATVEPGDNAVAVGNPGFAGDVLENTQTFGRVSTLLKHGVAGQAVGTHYVQTDAATNHGNSGGPLFVKKQDRFHWAGVNTLGGASVGYEGLSFAIDAQQALTAEYFWCKATPQEIVSLFNQAGVSVGVYKR